METEPYFFLTLYRPWPNQFFLSQVALLPRLKSTLQQAIPFRVRDTAG
jgi:hypothetical protein